jgi:hypothetical protein
VLNGRGKVTLDERLSVQCDIFQYHYMDIAGTRLKEFQRFWAIAHLRDAFKKKQVREGTRRKYVAIAYS